MAQLKDMQTGASGDAFTLTTVNSTTVDTTNLEATNLKAKDGTAAGSIANSTGVVTLASTVLTTTDINGGTVDGTTIGATTPSTVVATQVDITAQGDLRLQDTTGGQYVALQAPSTVATSYTLTLPVDDGTSGQALITDGSGVLSWSSAASGDVYGPASATDNAVARYDGTTGKIIQNSAVTIADDGATVIAANSTTNGLRITQTGLGNALLVEDSANPDATPFVIDSVGRTIIGASTTYAGVFNNAFLQAHAVGGNGAIDGFRYSADQFGVDLGFLKSRSATTGTQTVVQSGDALGVLRFAGSDGVAFKEAANITASVDGTPGTNDMPGRLVFSTTADGTTTTTERMRIDNQGRVGVGGSPSTFTKLHILGTLPSASTASRSMEITATIPSTSTAQGWGYYTTLSTQATAFTLADMTHYRAGQGTIGAGSAVTNQFGFVADNTLTGATNNYGFHSNIASGTGRYNFYANGTADNYFAGKVGVGRVPTSDASQLTVGGTNTLGTFAEAIMSISTFGNGVNSRADSYISFPSVNNATGTLSNLNHYFATQGTYSTTVTSQFGYHVDSSLTGATNNYGFYSNLASGTGRWNFYAAGTAVNFFAGDVRIGQSSTSTPGLNNTTDGFGIRSDGYASFSRNAVVVGFNRNTTDGDLITFRREGVEVGSIEVNATFAKFDGAVNTPRTAVTAPAATDGNVFSGTYTPTQISTNTNVDAVTFNSSSYMRVGNIVTVIGMIGVDATTALTSTTVKFSIPVASNFSVGTQLIGMATPYAVSSNGPTANLFADSGNDCVTMSFAPTSTASVNYGYHFTYRVI
jgi:hypothetical protein